MYILLKPYKSFAALVIWMIDLKDWIREACSRIKFPFVSSIVTNNRLNIPFISGVSFTDMDQLQSQHG